MDRSPMPKKQKLTGTTSFNDVKDELETVVDLRKSIKMVLEQIYFEAIFNLPQRLKRTELKLNKIETCEVPDMDPIFQGFKTLSKEYDETVQKMCEHIPLLNVLEQKKNCPIARIIDDI